MKNLIITNFGLIFFINLIYGQTEKSTYVPIDPMPVRIIVDNSYDYTNKDILELLPDETTKFASRELNTDIDGGYMSFVSASSKDDKYEVIFDWIKYSSVNALAIHNGKAELILQPEDLMKTTTVKNIKGEIFLQKSDSLINSISDKIPTNSDIVKIVMGVGVRMIAKFVTKKRNVSIPDILGLAVAASNNKIEGSLEINTLGITGESVTSLIPLPTEINKGSIQNLLSNVAAIREKIYTMEKNKEDFLKVMVTPRIIGFQNLSSTPYTPNQISSYLYKKIPYMLIKGESTDALGSTLMELQKRLGILQ
ncbi:hypothetical protein [Ulvibacterium sp.]|uniref:hypothetical protein n=1 Tax=Ulvibacterium sp. TaxID=2665914 RepID=UPI00262BFB5B|nr:hypothetical protein [Ulvibacterium sp.]